MIYSDWVNMLSKTISSTDMHDMRSFVSQVLEDRKRQAGGQVQTKATMLHDSSGYMDDNREIGQMVSWAVGYQEGVNAVSVDVISCLSKVLDKCMEREEAEENDETGTLPAAGLRTH